MDSTILSIIGSNSSGKTTAAVKLATMLADKGENVVLVFCDQFIPPAAYVLPSSITHAVSLGVLLTNNHISQNDVLSAMVSINKNLSVLGYTKNENALDYPSITNERVNEIITYIRPLADYIIFDCSCIFEIDRLSFSSMQQADKIFKLITPDVKGIAFEQCNKKHFDESFAAKTTTIMTLVDYSVPFEMAGQMVKANEALNILYDETLAVQMRECELFEDAGTAVFDAILAQFLDLPDELPPDSKRKPAKSLRTAPKIAAKPKQRQSFFKKQKSESRDEF